ncbi:MAG: serine/threonine-protein kinase [Clostridium sp.]
MGDMKIEFKLSKYSTLKVIKENDKAKVELVLNEQDGLVYIKKTLFYSKKEVYEGLKKIENEHLPRIYEILEWDGRLVIIEEFINGANLSDILKREGSLSEEKTKAYTLSLCEALQCLHSLKSPIIHRDIKPSNIIIDNKGKVKLIDFDASRVYKEEETEDTQILGTNGYLPPEQLGYCQTDGRSDIYSLGVVINEMLTGQHHSIEKHTGKFSDIINRCLKLAPELRYENISELVSEINKIKLNEEAVIHKEKIVTPKKINEKKIPGFRSNNPKHKIIAICGYAFMIFGLTVYENGFAITELLSNIGVSSILFSLTLLYTNYRNIQEKLPFVKENKKVALTVYSLIIIVVLGLIFGV